MKLYNCKLQEVEEVYGNKKIVFFGKGSWLKLVQYTPLMKLKEQFSYIIDNAPGMDEKVGDILLKVYSPEKMLEEDECIVILMSPVYMYDMYCCLKKMNLGDGIKCFAFPFMQMISDILIDESTLDIVVNTENKPKIPKMIHSFWFSGDEKPYEYQKCVDTWAKYLLDYEIKEWNLDNYDWHKNAFLKCAIEQRAWAFATDYARLDVLNEYGGIYLDMDVEVYKPFDNLLGNDVILSYGNNVMVDLAILGSVKQNGLIQDLLKLYDNVPLPKDKNGFVSFFQPVFVSECLKNHGVRMDGSLQYIGGIAVLPSKFMMPMDTILYKTYPLTECTYSVHYDNFGWSFGKENKHSKKMKDNNLLWDLIEN